RRIDAKGVTKDETHVRALAESVGKRRLERPVELDCVHQRNAIGEKAREHAEAGTDLEHDVAPTELGEPPDHTEDVLVDEKVLAPPLLRDHPHGLTMRAA